MSGPMSAPNGNKLITVSREARDKASTKPGFSGKTAKKRSKGK